MFIRPFTLVCTVLAGISGMVLYTQKHKTTLLDHQIAKIVYDTQKIKDRTAMLRTEWTLLNQPDRLETLAHNFLPDLHPLAPTQFVQIASLAQSLPAIQKIEHHDQIREQISQTVAQDHAQIQVNSHDPQPQPDQHHKNTLITVTDDHSEDTASPFPSENRPIRQHHETVNTSRITASSQQKSIKSTLTDPDVTKHHNPKTTKDLEEALASSLTEKTVNKSVKSNNHPNFSIADHDNASSSPSNKDQEPIKKNISSKRSAFVSKDSSQIKTQPASSIQMARYNMKKTHHSESAFGDDGDDSLPPPVPFSH